MADDKEAGDKEAEDTADQSEDKSEAPEEKPKRFSKKIIIIVGAVVLVIALAGGLFAMGALDSMLGIDHAENEKPAPVELELGVPVYLEQPEFIADLKSGKCVGSLLKLSLTIQIDEEYEDILTRRQPKIIDRIQQYLRSQTKEDLSGKEGADKLRDNLVQIVNATIKPASIHYILFRSFVIQ